MCNHKQTLNMILNQCTWFFNNILLIAIKREISPLVKAAGCSNHLPNRFVLVNLKSIIRISRELNFGHWSSITSYLKNTWEVITGWEVLHKGSSLFVSNSPESSVLRTSGFILHTQNLDSVWMERVYWGSNRGQSDIIITVLLRCDINVIHITLLHNFV